MNSHELQRRIQGGDRDAFRELYAVCGQGVYLRAQEALGDAEAARRAVKQVFLNLHREILSSDRPLDIDARLAALTEAELDRQRPADAAAPADDAQPAAPVIPAPAPPARSAPDPFDTAPYQPPLERAQAYMQADQPVPRRKKREEKPPQARGNAVITVLIVLFLLLFLWVLAGILMDFEVIPRIDLGFRWFNEAVFPLFSLKS